MNASERIRTIKDISNMMKLEEWSIIDLTLREFGLPTLDSWSSDKESYIVEIVSGAKKEVLEGLSLHLGITREQPRLEEIDVHCWQSRRFRLFLSHLSSDKVRTAQLQQALSRYYISSFVAHVDIEPTREWQSEIELALNSCHALAALLVPGFHESKWTDQEIGIVMGRGKLILPIRLGIDPYGFFGKYQGIQGYNKPIDELAHDIFNVLNSNKSTQKYISEAIVNLFEDSSSFEEAKSSMALVEELEYLDEKIILRIGQAVSVNSQLRNSFVVPDRAKALIERFRRDGK